MVQQMPDPIYTASKTKTQDRPGWTISFRHPLRTDTNGLSGRKVRKGLGTTDDAEADRLVAEMNVLLSNPAWWSAAKREEAEHSFSSIITAAFYEGVQAGLPDSWKVRDRNIEIPGPEEGYSRVLLVGTTGAGKTSLLRHLIGSDPERDRFPSTSTARTTISDIEVVLKPGPYSAVVTFFSEFWVQANLEECILDGCAAWWDTASRSKVADRFLNHRDQRFRLSYALGQWIEKVPHAEEDDWSFGNGPAPTVLPEEDAVPSSEREANEVLLKRYVERIVTLSERSIKFISKQIGEDLRSLTGPDREAAQELFEEHVRDDENFDPLVDDVLRNIKRKFERLKEGHIDFKASGWPSKWSLETDERPLLIDQIRWFSSNSADQFGRLLTPFVDGVRVRGPLFPDFTEKHPKLVLYDGQGLGHTPDSAASVTTQITRRFEDSDVILLVDNAQQPMQAASLSVLRAVAVGGHERKLAIAFTHFDQVEGINLPTFALKRAHVMASVTNGLSNLKDSLGNVAVKSIERSIDHQSFVLGALDKPNQILPTGVKGELERMLEFFIQAIEPSEKPAARPSYSPDGLLLALQVGARGFRRKWAARLGLETRESTYKEHWTRIKALTKRIAGELDIEYDTLKPVADLLARLSEEISQFLDHPSRWKAPVPDEEDAEAVIAGIKRQVYSELHALTERRLLADHLADWRNAYRHGGRGSARLRARDINSIYETGAPIVSTLVSEHSAEFIKDVRKIVYTAIRDNGGDLDAVD
jgi:hypothetical protein